MKNRIALAILVGFLLIGTADIVAQGEETETRTLKGEWSWGGNVGDLEAVFTATGEGRWDVSFHFNFRGPHVYAGTAEGGLLEGTLRGEVLNDSGKRSFTFAGAFEDGKYRGTHAEVIGGKERETGKLTMRP